MKTKTAALDGVKVGDWIAVNGGRYAHSKTYYYEVRRLTTSRAYVAQYQYVDLKRCRLVGGGDARLATKEEIERHKTELRKRESEHSAREAEERDRQNRECWIHALESGARKPSLETAKALCKVFEVSLATFDK